MKHRYMHIMHVYDDKKTQPVMSYIMWFSLYKSNLENEDIRRFSFASSSSEKLQFNFLHKPWKSKLENARIKDPFIQASRS